MSEHCSPPAADVTQQSSSPTVILMGGLPASGKSTLVKKITRRYDGHAIHLEYDNVEDSLISETSEDGRREAWNRARKLVVDQLEGYLQKRKKNNAEIFIMDDNFHLRGMRKQIHRLLLRYKPVRFGILWLDTPLEECMRRNQKRERKVPDHILVKMHQVIELPRAQWESSWLKIHPETSVASIFQFIDSCADIIDLPDTSFDEEKQESDRQITIKNEVHAWDKRLRAWVGIVARYDKHLARKANHARKTLMSEIKDDALDPKKEASARFLSLVLSNERADEKPRLFELLHNQN